ncbi:MAG: ABC transporter ATP-binding protein [Clostridium sp.]|nr:ABC transporter ATP-binding protein [Clostridium sp.]
MSNILEIKDLNLGFNLSDGYRQAIYNVNFELKKSEMLAVVGESGCGKTISTMSILQLLPETAEIKSGEILFKGENLLSFNQKQMQKIRGKKIALIPQDPMTSLNPLYTIGNQLVEVIELHQGLKGKQAFERAVEALEKVKIPDASEKMKSYPHEFSGGMKQRVIIAMALACNAEIIIADEPTTALDVTVQAQIMEILREIKEKFDISIILITHDLGVVAENADKIAVMYSGRIVEYASKDELLNNPKHPYTKALLNVILDINSKNVETIEGQPPSIMDDISGCPFHPRCIECMRICTKIDPELKHKNESMVACHLYD